MRLIFAFCLIFILFISMSACDSGSRYGGSQHSDMPEETGTSAANVNIHKSVLEEITSKVLSPGESNYKFIVEPQYDYCSDIMDGIMLTTKGSGDSAKYGFIDSCGKVIADAVYEDTRFYIGAYSASSGFSEGLAPVKKDGKWGYIGMDGTVAIGFKYDDAFIFNEGLALFSVNNKFGYINHAGEIVIEPVFESASEFHKGVAVVQTDSGYGFINKTGGRIIKESYDDMDFGLRHYNWTVCDLLRTGRDDLHGLVKVADGSVDIILQPVYSKIYPFTGDEAKFVKLYMDASGQYDENLTEEGFIDKSGRELIKWKINGGTSYEYLSDGMRLTVNGDGAVGFADKGFHLVIPYQFSDASPFGRGYATVVMNGKTGLIDKKGRFVLPAEYDAIAPDDKGRYAMVTKNKKSHLVSMDTFEAISGDYDEIFYGDVIIPVSGGGKIGFIDHTGKELAEPRFDDYSLSYYDDCIWVRAGENWIYMDKNGSRKFSGPYEEISDFTDGLACVKKDGKWGVIDRNGGIVLPFDFDKAVTAGKGLIKVMLDEKYGLVSAGQSPAGD